MFESGLAKAAGAEVLVQQRTEKWHATAAQRTSSETASAAFAGVGIMTPSFLRIALGVHVRQG